MSLERRVEVVGGIEVVAILVAPYVAGCMLVAVLVLEEIDWHFDMIILIPAFESAADFGTVPETGCTADQPAAGFVVVGDDLTPEDHILSVQP